MATSPSSYGRYTNREGEPLPMIVQKSDGGYMYSTTDLAAVQQRVADEGAARVLYVTDSGQTTHFEQVRLSFPPQNAPTCWRPGGNG